MTDTAFLSAFWANPIFWQSVLLALAVLLFGLVALLLRVARLNRNIKALALRLTALESRPGQSAPLPQKAAPLPKTDFANVSELRSSFSNSVDSVGNKTVFNIGGNKYRLIASIHFNRKKVYIRRILTHVEYDKGDWKQ